MLNLLIALEARWREVFLEGGLKRERGALELVLARWMGGGGGRGGCWSEVSRPRGLVACDWALDSDFVLWCGHFWLTECNVTPRGLFRKPTRSRERERKPS